MSKWVCSDCKHSYIELKSGFSVLRCSFALDQCKVDEQRKCIHKQKIVKDKQ